MSTLACAKQPYHVLTPWSSSSPADPLHYYTGVEQLMQGNMRPGSIFTNIDSTMQSVVLPDDLYSSAVERRLLSSGRLLLLDSPSVQEST